MPTTSITPEFSRILELDRVGSTNLEYSIEATPEERRALADRFDLLSIDSLTAEFIISKAQDPDSFRIDGELHSKVDQKCIITLGPVPASLTVPIHVILRPESTMPVGEENLMDIIDEPDIEYYNEFVADLGEITAQYLAISLDPYPRAPNVKDLNVLSEDNTSSTSKPFDVLAKLTKK